jgi:hypothetical protein
VALGSADAWACAHPLRSLGEQGVYGDFDALC